MDFLSNIPDPTPPMKPIEPSADGTLPLPFHQSAETSEQEIPIEDEQPTSDDIPFETNPMPHPDTEIVPTAEERLLETIVHEPAEKTEEPVPRIKDEQVDLLRAELANATEETRKAGIARIKAQQDFQSLKTRFAALETELTATKLDLTQTKQLNSQTENRFAEAEKQWTDKLSQLRHMLDEVEDTRDEVFQKRVPKLLFIGTLVAGIVAVIFAYMIGAGQATAPAPVAETPSMSPSDAPSLSPATPPAAPIPAPESPSIATLTPASAPVAMVPPVINARPKKPVAATHLPAEKTDWPILSGSRWSTTSSTKEQKVVFHYGVFTRGVELSSTARQDLKAIAAHLKGKPFQIEAEGHTDTTKIRKTKASGKDNRSIGLARAKAVANYLIASCGLPASQISTSSAGESDPPYPNTTKANLQKNRTVVLKITTR